MHNKFILGIMVLMMSFSLESVMATEKQGKKAIGKDPCDGSTAVELRICAEEQLKIANNKLNETYQKLKLKIDTLDDKEENKKSKRLLIKSQRAWIEFRDTECAFSGQIERYGATDMWKLASSVFCQARMTQERILELEKYLEEL
jgi:uncharacterized protein YecT (DUF1311 family)